MSDIKIMGVKVNRITLESSIQNIERFLQQHYTRVIYTPNTEIVMAAQKDNKLRQLLNEGDLVVPDGIGLVYASRIKGKSLPQRVTGFDLSMEIINMANKMDYKMFLLGGKKGVAKKAKEKLERKYKNLDIVGVHNGYFKGTHIGYSNHDEEKKVIEKINSSNVDILFVGLGAPRQEKWIHENKGKLNCKVIIGNGGTIDVIAGEVKRAPDIFQKLGLEWLYRLIKEPKRIKRQMVLPVFAFKVLFSREEIVE